MNIDRLLSQLDNLHQVSQNQYQIADSLLSSLYQHPYGDHAVTVNKTGESIWLTALGIELHPSKSFVDTRNGQWRTRVKFQSRSSAHTTRFYCNEHGHIFQNRHDSKPKLTAAKPGHLLDLLLENLKPACKDI